MPSIVTDTEYGRRKTTPVSKSAPKQQQPQWVPKYEPYNPFAPKKESRNEAVSKANATREPWRPFQTVANIFEQALNNPYNPFSRTQTMIGPQNNPWAPYWYQPPVQPQRRVSFAGLPAGAWQNESFFGGAPVSYVWEGYPRTGVSALPPRADYLTPQTFPVGAWQNENFFNIPDFSGPLYWTPQYVNAPQHAPSSGGGWSSWGGGGGGSSAAFYQGNYTQQRARWNETLLTWGLRQE